MGQFFSTQLVWVPLKEAYPLGIPHSQKIKKREFVLEESPNNNQILSFIAQQLNYFHTSHLPLLSLVRSTHSKEEEVRLRDDISKNLRILLDTPFSKGLEFDSIMHPCIFHECLCHHENMQRKNPNNYIHAFDCSILEQTDHAIILNSNQYQIHNIDTIIDNIKGDNEEDDDGSCNGEDEDSGSEDLLSMTEDPKNEKLHDQNSRNPQQFTYKLWQDNVSGTVINRCRVYNLRYIFYHFEVVEAFNHTYVIHELKNLIEDNYSFFSRQDTAFLQFQNLNSLFGQIIQHEKERKIMENLLYSSSSHEIVDTEKLMNSQPLNVKKQQKNPNIQHVSRSNTGNTTSTTTTTQKRKAKRKKKKKPQELYVDHIKNDIPEGEQGIGHQLGRIHLMFYFQQVDLFLFTQYAQLKTQLKESKRMNISPAPTHIEDIEGTCSFSQNMNSSLRERVGRHPTIEIPHLEEISRVSTPSNVKKNKYLHSPRYATATSSSAIRTITTKNQFSKTLKSLSPHKENEFARNVDEIIANEMPFSSYSNPNTLRKSSTATGLHYSMTKDSENLQFVRARSAIPGTRAHSNHASLPLPTNLGVNGENSSKKLRKYKKPKGIVDGENNTVVSSDEEEEIKITTPPGTSPQIVHINRMIKVIKSSYEQGINTLILALSFLKELDLNDETNQYSILNCNGVTPLLHLLISNHEEKIKIGAANILKKICQNPHIQQRAVKEHGLKILVTSLSMNVNNELKANICEIIAHCCERPKGRKLLRVSNGIKIILEIIEKNLNELSIARQTKIREHVTLLNCACRALWFSMDSKKNQIVFRKYKGIEVLTNLFSVSTMDFPTLLTPTFGTLMYISKNTINREELKKMGMIENIFDYIVQLCKESEKKFKESTKSVPKRPKSSFLVQKKIDEGLQIVISGLCFSIAVDHHVKELVQQFPPVLYTIADWFSNTNNDKLLEYCSGSLNEFSMFTPNAYVLFDLNFLIPKVISILKLDQEKSLSLVKEEELNVKVYSTGILSNCSSIDDCRKQMQSNGAVEILCAILKSTMVPSLLTNCLKTMGTLASDKTVFSTVLHQDGIRLFWSLLRNEHADVQYSAAQAICKSVYTKETAEQIGRQFVGGLPVLIRVLENSTDERVISFCCLALAKLCLAENNRAVFSEEGAAYQLANIIKSPQISNFVKTHASLAISEISKYRNNRKLFLELEAISPLVSIIQQRPNSKSKLKIKNRVGDDELDFEEQVNRNIIPDEETELLFQNVTLALSVLSEDESIAILLRNLNTVPYLVRLLSSKNETIQVVAASAISNIRKFFLHNDNKMQHQQMEVISNSILHSPSTKILSSSNTFLSPNYQV